MRRNRSGTVVASAVALALLACCVATPADAAERDRATRVVDMLGRSGQAPLGVSPAPRMETGTTVVGDAPVPIALQRTYVRPVVVTTHRHVANARPVVVRVDAVTANGFSMRLVNPSGFPAADETVHYLVVEEGSWQFDGHRVEARRYGSVPTDSSISWVGEVQTLAHTFSNPVVVGQVMSEADPDWSVFWCRGASRTDPPDGANLATGKTVCEDPDRVRAPEEVGFVVFESGHGRIGGIEFEAALGADTVAGVDNGPPFTYGFNLPFPGVPEIGIAQLAGIDGYNGGWAVLWGANPLTAGGIDVAIDEDQLGDSERSHTTEQVAYAVFQQAFDFEAAPCGIDDDCDDGLYCTGDERCLDGFCAAGGFPCGTSTCLEATDVCDPAVEPRLETMTVRIGSTPFRIPFVQTYASPVVVCSTRLEANGVPVVARVGFVDSTGFSLRLQNPTGDPVVEDDVTCLVVEEGVWTLDGVRFEARRVLSTTTDFKGSWSGQPTAFGQPYTMPVVLGQVMTENDPDWSTFWCRGASVNQPPSLGNFFVGKSVGEDPDTTRDDETLGVIVFEAGHGTFAGVEYEARLSEDVVRGVLDGAPHEVDFAQTFPAPPDMVVVSHEAQDGGDGGWAVTFGPTSASASQLFLAIDEDTLNDPDRNHTTEQVAYLAFARRFAWPPVACFDDRDCDDGELCTGVDICVEGACRIIPVDCDDPILSFP